MGYRRVSEPVVAFPLVRWALLLTASVQEKEKQSLSHSHGLFLQVALCRLCWGERVSGATPSRAGSWVHPAGPPCLGAWKLSMVNLCFPRSCLAQPSPHELLFFSSEICFKISSFQDRRGFSLHSPIKSFFFPPCLSPSRSHNYWQIADFPSVGLTDNWLNSSLEVSVRHRRRRGAEGVGFCAYWKKIFSFFL